MLFKTTTALAATLLAMVRLGAGAGPVGGAASAKLTPPRNAAPLVARRRPRDSSTCTGAGMNSFIGGGLGNNAYGVDTAVLAGTSNTVCDDYSTIAGGLLNSISTGGSDFALYSFLGGGTENKIAGSTALVGAGTNNTVSGESSADIAGAGNVVAGDFGVIGAGSSNRITTSASATIGGGYSNSIVAQNVGETAYSGGSYSFIGGGSKNSILGTKDGAALYSTIGGGYQNAMTGLYGAIAGGYAGSVSGTAAAIGGGQENVASGAQAAIAGGFRNVASNTGAFVGGGSSSSATGQFSTVAGGYLNAANGTGSFAAGTQAKARTNGAFVWSDNASNTALQSTAPYQFMARASGGFYLYSNAAASSGVKLAPGSGAWSMLSDRTMKNDIVPLDDATVLAKVAALPVSEWSYNSERGVRHVGPMAQDFYAAFRVGEDDRHITSIDEDGVALAAIKALHAQNVALRARNDTLSAKLAAIGAREDSLAREVASLRVAVRAMRGR